MDTTTAMTMDTTTNMTTAMTMDMTTFTRMMRPTPIILRAALWLATRWSIPAARRCPPAT